MRSLFESNRNFLTLSMLARLSVITTFSLFAGSCVSVKIPTGGSDKVRATDIQLIPPANPYNATASGLADFQWTSSNTGNSISVFSECKVRNEPSLDVLQKEVLSAIENAKINTQRLIYNEREAVRIQAQGTLDGIPVQIDSMIFKKNTCSYTITYGGRLSNLKKEASYFEDFLKNFKAP